MTPRPHPSDPHYTLAAQDVTPRGLIYQYDAATHPDLLTHVCCLAIARVELLEARLREVAPYSAPVIPIRKEARREA